VRTLNELLGLGRKTLLADSSLLHLAEKHHEAKKPVSKIRVSVSASCF
jgi:hypothetical protein